MWTTYKPTDSPESHRELVPSLSQYMCFWHIIGTASCIGKAQMEIKQLETSNETPAFHAGLLVRPSHFFIFQCFSVSSSQTLHLSFLKASFIAEPVALWVHLFEEEKKYRTVHHSKFIIPHSHTQDAALLFETDYCWPSASSAHVVLKFIWQAAVSPDIHRV